MIPWEPSSPIQIDFRVATSAVEGLRWMLATLIADLGDMEGESETNQIHLSAKRARIRARLRENEAARATRLVSPAGQTAAEVDSVFSEGVRLSAALGGLDERLAGMEARIEGWRAEVATLRELSLRLREAWELKGRNIDSEIARYGRATRSLSQLFDEDSAGLSRSVLEGPVQRLADMSVRLQVVHRLVTRRLRGAVQEFSHCRAAAHEAVSEFDRLTFDLWPAALDSDGIAAALRELARRIPQPAVGRFERIGESRRFRRPLEIAIFRIVQQAVANALQHGRATRIDIVLSLHADRVVVVVRDDGEGFDVVATEARIGRTGGLGIITMRERAEIEGGALKLRSAPGAGTEVRVTFSLPPQAPVARRAPSTRIADSAREMG